jgi:hypothetical protein
VKIRERREKNILRGRGRGENIFLLEGSQASAAHPSDKDRMKVKTF